MIEFTIVITVNSQLSAMIFHSVQYLHFCLFYHMIIGLIIITKNLVFMLIENFSLTIQEPFFNLEFPQMISIDDFNF